MYHNTTTIHYHTLHLFRGFILEPSGQLKSSEKYSMLLNGPCTLKFPGEWYPVSTLNLRASGRCLEHHVLAAEIQNICDGVYWLRPGNRASTLLRSTHFLYAR